ncbi:MAG: S8 family serine peptidase, partial [Actinomycetota bacterium]|nr:S8 family serine peptidase [Actinomycetota bacterium]
MLSFDPERSVADVIDELAGTPGIVSIDPNYRYEIRDTPDDPGYPDFLWGLDSEPGANAVGAWDAGYTGSRSVIVAVMDSGIDITHPDLAANIWTNPGETDPDNGIDDDGNDYIDDVNGWDFAADPLGEDYATDGPSVYDNYEVDLHGTHVAGTIGAVGDNGIGVVGVNWQVTILPLKFFGENQERSGSTDAMIDAFDYVLDLVEAGHNIVAINNSWGRTGSPSQTEIDKINELGAAGILFVVAAGNDGNDNDVTADYPSTYVCDGDGARDWDCIISVTAHDVTGSIPNDWSYFDSDDGAWVSGGPHVGASVDLSAPGVGIYSTFPVDYPSQPDYLALDGTSMAAPHVTGAIGLCASVNDRLDGRAIRAALMASVNPDAELATLIDSGGMLDVGAMLDLCSTAENTVAGTVDVDVNETLTQAELDIVVFGSDVSGADVIEATVAPYVDGVCGETVRWAYSAFAGDYTSVSVRLLDTRAPYCVRARAHGLGTSSVTEWSNTVIWTTRAGYECVSVDFDPTLLEDVIAGEVLDLDDDDSDSITVAGATTYFGQTLIDLTLNVASNGLLSLSNTGVTELLTGNYINPLPYRGVIWPSGVIAPWHTDLNPRAGDGAVYRLVNDDTIHVAWVDVQQFADPPTDETAAEAVTVQAVLNRSTGDVTLQYDTVRSVDSSDPFDPNGWVYSGITSPDNTSSAALPLEPAELTSQTAIRCTWADTDVAVVKVEVAGTGSVTGLGELGPCGTECSAYLNRGEQVTLTATPATGQVFTGWDGGCGGRFPTCTVDTSDGNVIVNATFADAASYRAVDIAITGQGSVTLSEGEICVVDCSVMAAVGSTESITARGDDDWVLTGLGGACSGQPNPCTLTVDDDADVDVTFSELVVLTINRLGGGGGTVRDIGGEIRCVSSDLECVSPELPTTYQYGLQAIADADSKFVAWSSNCLPSDDDPGLCAVAITEDTSVTAWFSSTLPTTAPSPALVSALPESSEILSASEVGTGETVVVNVPGGTFAPYERVVITLHSEPVEVADLHAALDGS